jgi:hypothetical protein
MSWGYPEGVSQSTHDRAFGEQEPWGDRDRDYDPLDELDEVPEPPLFTPQPDAFADLRTSLAKEPMISTRVAVTALRVLRRIEEQGDRAYKEGRIEDNCSLFRLYGKLSYAIFEHSAHGELGQ